MNSDFIRMVVEAKMDDLFNKSAFFNICDVDRLGDMLGIEPRNHPEYAALRALHCINYRDMRPELRAQLPEVVARVCSAQRVQISVDIPATPEVKIEPVKERTGVLRLLFGRKE